FERLPGGPAQIVPDLPDLNKEINVYANFLTKRASRFSQKLSKFNNSIVEELAFINDDNALDVMAYGLLLVYQTSWGDDKPTLEKFTDELLAVADMELTALYQQTQYKNFVESVAIVLKNTLSMDGAEIERLVGEKQQLFGIDVKFISLHFNEFM